jgi:hypothetical protein
MVPEQRLDKLAGVDRMVSAKHGTYFYRNKSQPGDAKPESVNYWTLCSMPDLITRKVELMLELQIIDSVDVANGLNSYETISGEGWDVVVVVSVVTPDSIYQLHTACLASASVAPGWSIEIVSMTAFSRKISRRLPEASSEGYCCFGITAPLQQFPRSSGILRLPFLRIK